MVLLGKALSGGVYPVSCVLSRKDILLQVLPGEHGSTYGGVGFAFLVHQQTSFADVGVYVDLQNPLACAVAQAALEVIVNEDLCNRAENLGQKMRSGLSALRGVGPNGGWITEVRGKGLLNAIVIDETKSTKGRGAWDLCCVFKSKGLLAKPTHVNIIRLAPPLIISEEQLDKILSIIKESLEELDTVSFDPVFSSFSLNGQAESILSTARDYPRSRRSPQGCR